MNRPVPRIGTVREIFSPQPLYFFGKMWYNIARGERNISAKTEYGPLAQLGERQVRNLEVMGSIPTWSIHKGHPVRGVLCV